MVSDNEVGGEVVSIFDRKKRELELEAELNAENAESSESFLSIMEKNRESKERMKKDRNKANRSVLRSYRLK